MGLFQASYELREAGLVDKYEEEQLLSILDWFNDNLEKPESFSRSKKPHSKGVAISWFKDTATNHIAKMYEFKNILEAHGVIVEVIKSARVGYVVYEDDFQITAEPYAETVT